jgi:hypothetical protein
MVANSKITLLSALLLIGSSSAFSPSHNLVKKQLRTIMSAEKPTGSFFNKVPDNNGNNDGGGEGGTPPKDPFEKSIEELIRSRNSKPLASNPSTVGGVPTAKATGTCDSIIWTVNYFDNIVCYFTSILAHFFLMNSSPSFSF